MSDRPYAALSPTWQDVPMNLHAEMALLGGLLANNKAAEKCEGLRAEHFAGEHHGEIFGAIMESVAAGRQIDAVTLRWEFDNALLAQLTTAMVATGLVGEYARVIKQSADARKWLALGQALAHGAQTGRSSEELTALATQHLQMQDTISTRQCSLDQAMDAAIAAMDRARRGESAGISCGFPSIDKRLGGLEPGLVYVLAGRPGMGKSALGHQIAINAARSGVGVLELSLEMSARQLGMRALSTASGVHLNALKTGEVDLLQADRVVQARKERANLPLTIDDAGGQTATQIAIKARAAKRRHGLGLVMIDHLHLMAPEEHDARHGGTWAVERASATVLQIAKDCECPVLLLAQLNRGVEGREDKRPLLSDLRQAGSIEQDAYAVGFVYRPEYYLQGEPAERDGEREETFVARKNAWYEKKDQARGQADLIWAKVRDGEIGTDKLRFDGPTTSFSEVWA